MSATPRPAHPAARDALSGALFDVTDVICGNTWTDDEIGELLLPLPPPLLNAAMADEVTALAELSALKRAAGVWSTRRFSAEEFVNEKVTAE